MQKAAKAKTKVSEDSSDDKNKGLEPSLDAMLDAGISPDDETVDQVVRRRVDNEPLPVSSAPVPHKSPGIRQVRRTTYGRSVERKRLIQAEKITVCNGKPATPQGAIGLSTGLMCVSRILFA